MAGWASGCGRGQCARSSGPRIAAIRSVAPQAGAAPATSKASDMISGGMRPPSFCTVVDAYGKSDRHRDRGWHATTPPAHDGRTGLVERGPGRLLIPDAPARKCGRVGRVDDREDAMRYFVLR